MNDENRFYRPISRDWKPVWEQGTEIPFYREYDRDTRPNNAYRTRTNQQETQPIHITTHYLAVNPSRGSRVACGLEDQIPPFMRGADILHVPAKLESVLFHHIPDCRLRSIHPDLTVARELVMIIAANLSDTYFQEDRSDGWKALHSSILRRQVSNLNDRMYRNILDLLIEGSRLKGAIIEEDSRYVHGTRCRQYRLAPAYRNKGIKPYRLTSAWAVGLRKKSFLMKWRKLLASPIGKNMLDVYGMASILTTDQAMEYGKALAKRGYVNKKGKTLTIRGKKKWTDASTRVFVEDQVELYRLLTEGGYMLPIVSSEAGGMRVVDSFTLMPSWIREMVQLQSQRTKEYDFAALHPNISSTIFGGTGERISHDAIAAFLDIPIAKAKKANLSFFNAPYAQMVNSPVWAYYHQREPKLLENLLQHRQESGKPAKDEHKATSGAMLAKETELMIATIHALNVKGIFPIYIYDALQGKEQDGEIIRATMNATARMMGINTEVR